ncbi:MAG: TetR/AcrR family transcriptional regulator [Fulvivirga sp.]
MKESIVNESFKLFRQYGHKSVTMDDVAKNLGISKKTLYQHFSNKDELLAAGVTQLITCILYKIEEINIKQEHPFKRLSKIYYLLIKEFHAMELVYIYSINKYDTKALKVINLFKDNLISNLVRPLLDEASEMGLVRPELNVELFLNIRIKDLDLHYLKLMGYAPGLSLKEAFLHLVAYPIFSICTIEGHVACEKIVMADIVNN